MAEIIDSNLKVVLGQLIRVKNLNKLPTANQIYIALHVQDEDGENQRCLLMTEIECSDMQKVYSKFFDKMIYGRLYDFLINKKHTFVVRVKNYNGQDRFFRISKTQLFKFQKRAQKNLQDLPKKSYFTDLLD